MIFKKSWPGYGVDALAVPPGGDVIAASTGKELWLTSPDFSALIAKIPANATCLCFLPNGAWIAYADGGTIVVLERHTLGEVARFKGHRDSVTDLQFSTDGRTLLSGSDDLTVLLWTLRPVERAKPQAKLETLWEQLAGAAPAACRALWRFGEMGQRGVEFLQQRLKEGRPLSQKEIDAWIVGLDKADPRIRLPARAVIATVDHGSKSALGAGLALVRSTEARQFLHAAIDRLELNHPVSADELRLLRVVQALEWIGTPEARNVLRDAAAKHPNPLFTRECSAALRRMERIENKP